MKTGEEWLQLKNDFHVSALSVSADKQFLVAAVVNQNRDELALWQLPQPAS